MKEMVVDRSRNKSPHSPVCISRKDVERATAYKFLGVQVNNKMEWSMSTEAVCKRGTSRLYIQRWQSKH